MNSNDDSKAGARATAEAPVRFEQLNALANAHRALVLAPHPDDFDAIAVALRLLHERGCELHVAVLTTGVSGVRDDFPDAVSDARKAAIREVEQRESCMLFGLPESNLSFLRLVEDERGHQRMDAENTQCIRRLLHDYRPDMVFMPHGYDTNIAHQRTWLMFETVAQEADWRMWACLNRDAKTVSMRIDGYMAFDEPRARWKASLLRTHASQQQRNLLTRGHGFDDRVLALNRQAAQECGLAQSYAEVFELQKFGPAELRENDA